MEKNVAIIYEIEALVGYLPLEAQRPIRQRLDIFYRYLDISGKCLQPNVSFELKHPMLTNLQNQLRNSLLSTLDLIKQKQTGEVIKNISKQLSSVYRCIQYLTRNKNLDKICQEEKYTLQQYMNQLKNKYSSTHTELINQIRDNNERQKKQHESKRDSIKVQIGELQSKLQTSYQQIYQLSNPLDIQKNLTSYQKQIEMQIVPGVQKTIFPNKIKVQSKEFHSPISSPLTLKNEKPKTKNEKNNQTFKTIINLLFTPEKELPPKNKKIKNLYLTSLQLISEKTSSTRNQSFKYRPDSFLQNLVEQLEKKVNYFRNEDQCNIILYIEESLQQIDEEYLTTKLNKLKIFLENKYASLTLVGKNNKSFFNYIESEVTSFLPGINVRTFEDLDEEVYFPPLSNLNNQQDDEDDQDQEEQENNVNQMEDILRIQKEMVENQQKRLDEACSKQQKVKQQYQQEQLQKIDQKDRYSQVDSLAVEIRRTKEELTILKSSLQNEERIIQELEFQQPESELEKHSQHSDFKELSKNLEKINTIIMSIKTNADISLYQASIDKSLDELYKHEKNLQRVLISLNGNSIGLFLKLNQSMDNSLDKGEEELMDTLVIKLFDNPLSQQQISTLKSEKIQNFLNNYASEISPQSQDIQKQCKIIENEIKKYKLFDYFNKIYDSVEEFNNLDYSKRLLQNIIKTC